MNGNMQLLALMGLIVGFMAVTGLWMEPRMRPMRVGTEIAASGTPAMRTVARAANLR